MDPRDAYRLGTVPLGVAIAGLFVIVIVRSHATYWVGRGIVRGARAVDEHDGAPRWWHSSVRRLEAWSGTPSAQRGLDLVRRWGPIAVTLAYLTVGLQTAVVGAAGLVRMPYLRFALASIPGAIAWAVIWATIGFGALWAAVALFARSPWALAGTVVVLVLVVGWLVRRRTRPSAAVQAGV
ncbi:VTT domain-containing protein [uncultured Cellulomonas sp.]|uniref:DedA family protein n=1 Tax=uncultured Cellulomonas sp. TaxID=189682 RepID=UPI0028E72CBE|nr:VTT domain-containing protein [uncultured Cellulomonas sp.]